MLRVYTGRPARPASGIYYIQTRRFGQASVFSQTSHVLTRKTTTTKRAKTSKTKSSSTVSGLCATVLLSSQVDFNIECCNV